MKILLDIPVTLYDKVIQGKADKRTMMTVIESGQTLPDGDKLLSESELIKALDSEKHELEQSQEWERVYGLYIAKEIVRGCPEVAP